MYTGLAIATAYSYTYNIVVTTLTNIYSYLVYTLIPREQFTEASSILLYCSL